MACSQRNLIVNGTFQKGIAPWTGTNIRHVRNPENANDGSILMSSARGKSSSTLNQVVNTSLEYPCAYYLTFRVINVSPPQTNVRFFATVVYMTRQNRVLRSTPLMVLPPNLPKKTYKPFFSIVPPPPNQAKKVKISFLLEQGALYIDTIRLVSHSV